MFLTFRILLPLSALLLAESPPPKAPAPSFYATPIGPSIGLDAAKKIAAAASAEARKNGWLMVIAVVDPAGTLVYYEKADNTQLGSAAVAVAKARSAALYKRPTKVFQDSLAKGAENLRILRLEGAVPLTEAEVTEQMQANAEALGIGIPAPAATGDPRRN